MPETLTKPKSLKKQLSHSQLTDLEDRWLDGWDAIRLAKVYKVENKQVQTYIRKHLINKHRSRFERLAIVFDQLFEAADIAHRDYKSKPGQGKSVAYTGIVNALRGAMVDLENAQSSVELAEEIVKLALNPLIKKLIQVLIDELGATKEELLLKFPEEDANRLVNEVVTRVGSHFSTALGETQERLESVLGARDKNRKKALDGNTTKKKHRHLRAVPD